MRLWFLVAIVSQFIIDLRLRQSRSVTDDHSRLSIIVIHHQLITKTITAEFEQSRQEEEEEEEEEKEKKRLNAGDNKKKKRRTPTTMCM
jgi:hypothetical protein